jgi:hypothetical protein
VILELTPNLPVKYENLSKFGLEPATNGDVTRQFPQTPPFLLGLNFKLNKDNTNPI